VTEQEAALALKELDAEMGGGLLRYLIQLFAERTLSQQLVFYHILFLLGEKEYTQASADDVAKKLITAI